MSSIPVEPFSIEYTFDDPAHCGREDDTEFRHEECMCASDAWENTRSDMTDFLRELDRQYWAVRRSGRRGEDLADHRGCLDVGDITSALGLRNGVDYLLLCWNGAVLSATGSDAGGGSSSITLTPLSDAQMLLAEEWYRYDPEWESAGCAVSSLEAEFVRQAVRILDADEERYSNDIVAALKGSGLLSEVALDMVVRLIPTWGEDLEALFSTPRLVGVEK